jgi:streptomycin 6-kinase
MANGRTDAAATSIACSVIRSLHSDATDVDTQRFTSVSDLGKGFGRLRAEFNGGVGPFPELLVEEAERLWLELDSSAGKRVLLHGDLHHDNIISATRLPWLAIDPKGYVGDAAFEPGAVLRNLWQDRHVISNPAKTIESGIDQFADELDIDWERVRGWALAQAVLSVWWSYEDNDPDWADSLEIAEMIAGIRR